MESLIVDFVQFSCAIAKDCFHFGETEQESINSKQLFWYHCRYGINTWHPYKKICKKQLNSSLKIKKDFFYSYMTNSTIAH